MPNGTQAIGIVRVLAVLFMAGLAGCTISIQPWTKQQPPPANPQFQDPNNPNMMMKNAPHQPSMPANNEATAQMIKNLNEEQDLRKSLQEQVVSLKKQLAERQENLRQASFEIDDTTKQIRKTREEFRQWQGEMEELRERIRKLEDYRSSAKPLFDDLNRYLEREKDPAKTYKYPVPKQ